MNIQRYDMDEGINEITEQAKGEYVKYGDVKDFIADAKRLEKLLTMVTTMKIKFDRDGTKPAQFDIKVKSSVTTSFGFRAELRRNIDEMEHTGP